MNLTLIMGRAGSGKTHYCLENIKQKLAQQADGKALILLVPEQATFQLERDLANDPKLNGFARAYVLGFRRLANRVLLETGGALRPHITELGKKLVLGRLLTEHLSELTLFQKSARETTFSATLSELVGEFKNYGVTPEQLASLAQEVASPYLKAKLHDLELIYKEFEAFLSGRYTDPEDYLSLLAQKIPEASLLDGAQVWVDGFSWFTPCERAVLEQLMKVTDKLHITLCLSEPSLPEHALETSLLHRPWNTRRQVREIAAKLGLAVDEVELTKNYRFVHQPVLQHLEQNFFRQLPTPYVQQAEGLMLMEAANLRTEIDGIARDILRLCREKNFRWRDVAVLIRDTASYDDIVETVFTQYDIPYFSDKHRKAVHHPVAELLRSALEVIDSRWDYEPVFRTLKSDLFALSREQVDKLENYVLEFGIRGSRWQQAEPWDFVKRFSLSEEEETVKSEKNAAFLAEINEIRDLAREPLLQLAQSLAASSQVSDITKALYQFMQMLDVPKKLEDWADDAEADGNLSLAGEHRQVLGTVFDLFDQMVEALGNEDLSLTEYLEILNDGLNNLEFSIIPPGLDYVIVTGLERGRLPNVKAIYVPGVNEGILPMRVHAEGILTDEERGLMLAAGVEIAPGNTANVFAEQFLIYTALTRASEYLWFSYALADGEGKGLLPSIIIKKLRELVPALTVAALPVEPQAGHGLSYVAHPGRALSLLVFMLNLCKKGQELDPVWQEVYNWGIHQPVWQQRLKQMTAGLFYHNESKALNPKLARELYLKNDKLLGSVTRFESFEACPFKHFARYGLSLKERAIFRLAAPDYGQFLHAALKEFGQRMLSAGQSWGELPTEQREQVCDDIVAELTPKLQNEILMSSAQHKHLAGRLNNTVKRAVNWLAEFDKASCFKPVVLEQAFGRGSDCWPALTFTLKDGTELNIAGQIDRVDVAEAGGTLYLLIIDYKSGGMWLKLPDVYYGLKLQLLTYLLVAKQHWAEKNNCPAGILYFFLKNPSVLDKAPLPREVVEKKISDQLKMPGWVLYDQDIAKLIDQNLADSSDFVKLGLKKDQEFKKTSLPYLKTEEEFTLLLQHVTNMLKKVGTDILSGRNEISPYKLGDKEACTQCDYRAVCQFDLLLPGNNYNQLQQLDDQDILQKLSAQKGEEEL